MKRVFLTVMDAVGAGELPDADKYNSVGAHTLGHVIAECHPELPNMAGLGLSRIPGTGYPEPEKIVGAYGRAAERSAGKDTTSGHWELAGVRVTAPFPVFPDGFPQELIDRYEKAIGYPTIGNKAASGTTILEELGEEHRAKKAPIVYTSADSVFQIACNEEIFPRSQLYEFCRIAREMLQGPWGVGRVIARPFIGMPGHYTRTDGRRDFSIPPCGKTLPDCLKEAGMDSIGIGKIEDIFAMQGLTESDHAVGNPACIASLLKYAEKDFNGLCFTNLVDTDSAYGHRNDPAGFAKALEEIDRSIPEMMKRLHDGDLMIITADHGCDPTTPSTDHDREYIPLMIWHPGMDHAIDLGTRKTYADVAATCAEWLGLDERFGAESFASML